jgi:aspartyl-tRNA(Asn)/glutamyl-tRNA(Gln) amidotransferase subunit C
MNKIDTSNIEPMSHPLDEANNLRKDIASKEIERDDFQKSAPLIDDGFYLTPKVIE